MRYLSLGEVLDLYFRIMEGSGGSAGVRDWGMLRSALAQARMTVEGEEVYPSVVEKAAALGFSIVMNHPMVDGNKRLGHASMELFLMLNGHEIEAPVDEQDRAMLALAAGDMNRQDLANWLEDHVVERR